VRDTLERSRGVGVVPTIDEFEKRHACLDLGLEAALVEQFTLELDETRSQACSKQLPAGPSERRTPASLVALAWLRKMSLSNFDV
jgi:hypothetical protein